MYYRPILVFEGGVVVVGSSSGGSGIGGSDGGIDEVGLKKVFS